jgi:hypothetical protein
LGTVSERLLRVKVRRLGGLEVPTTLSQLPTRRSNEAARNAAISALGQLRRNEAVGGESASLSIAAELVRCGGEREAAKGNRRLQK